MKEFWDERYAAHTDFYGEGPNLFFKRFIDSQPPGRLLLPGEGEGRNAIYAATNGWGVEAFDFSETARANAAERAEIAGVMLHYELKDIANYIPLKLYDVIALIYIHLPQEARLKFHEKLVASLARGGYIIIEAFSKKQEHDVSGGPEDVALLYDANEIRNDFAGLHVQLCEEKEIDLEEGDVRKGRANVVHLIAKKIV